MAVEATGCSPVGDVGAGPMMPRCVPPIRDARWVTAIAVPVIMLSRRVVTAPATSMPTPSSVAPAMSTTRV